jgi:V8-like Glu-specific endopeptidase
MAYKGKCKELKAHAFDVIPGKNGFNIFAKTTTKIGQHIARTVPNSGEFALVMRPDNLGFPVILD